MPGKTVDGLRALVIIYGLTKRGKCLNQSHTVYITYISRQIQINQKETGQVQYHILLFSDKVS